MARKTLKVRRALPLPEPDMPSDEELLAYVDGLVSPEDLHETERRLYSSPYCLDRLWILREALAEGSSDPI
jgi:anti-sigma factor RsiW